MFFRETLLDREIAGSPEYSSVQEMREGPEMAEACCAVKASGRMLVSCVSLASNRARYCWCSPTRWPCTVMAFCQINSPATSMSWQSNLSSVGEVYSCRWGLFRSGKQSKTRSRSWSKVKVKNRQRFRQSANNIDQAKSELMKSGSKQIQNQYS